MQFKIQRAQVAEGKPCPPETHASGSRLCRMMGGPIGLLNKVARTSPWCRQPVTGQQLSLQSLRLAMVLMCTQAAAQAAKPFTRHGADDL